MRIPVRNGMDISIDGAPVRETPEPVCCSEVAVLGRDYPDVRPALAVKTGEPVSVGTVLFRDRRNRALAITSPASGIISDVNWHGRGQLDSIVIEVSGDNREDFGAFEQESLASLSAATVRDRLLESGQWTAFRARPFERVPAPDVVPRAIFVTAIDTSPLAPDPFWAITEAENDFKQGLAVLSRLTDGPTYVCTNDVHEAPLTESSRVLQVRFLGAHPAGLPGTHIHALERISDQPDLWHIGYQDVVSIGRLFLTGHLSTQRVIGIGGPGARPPRLLRVSMGAKLSDVATNEHQSGVPVISGSVLNGHKNPGFLGRFHNQVSILSPQHASGKRGRRMRQMIFRGNAGVRHAANRPLGVAAGGMLPLPAFDRVWPYRTPVTPMLRALLSGDSDAARALGCTGLAEEDLALCTYVCAAGQDYGSALRQALQDVERQLR